ncbi:DUF3575 domain-containing protein [Sabulibacter ruber]|uniref:DUF3575 domain-containing protein n=1 Tax=Sabulibacter ruber TaxID=2811901 RepID=UPI001F60B9D9|nr:DUF3575 domain-containing protein [Sabulibacter ruber]
MRKIFTCILSLLVFQSVAQTAATPGDAPTGYKPTYFGLGEQTLAPRQEKEEVFRKNIVKINLSSLALNNYSFSYERSLTRKISLVAGYGFMPKTNVASMPLVEKVVDRYMKDEEDIVEQIKESNVAYKSYTGELRFYAGKKPGARGFYLSLYGRYMNLDAAYTHEYDTDLRTYDIPIDGNINGFGGGLMIGSQWLIARRITFDWYILGGHYGKMKLNLDGKADLSAMSAQERRDLEEDIESINDELPGSPKIDATVTEQGVTVKGNSPFAGIRGLGFSLGIAF